MKTKSLIIALASIGVIGTASAEEGKKERPQRQIPPEIIAKFDKDGDGELNEEERKAARATHADKGKERRKEMIAKFDKDGDGELNEEEKKAMHEAMRARMLEKFDKDGDGELNDEEKKAMRKAMQDRPGGPKGPHGKRGEGKRGDRKGGGDEAPDAL